MGIISNNSEDFFYRVTKDTKLLFYSENLFKEIQVERKCPFLDENIYKNSSLVHIANDDEHLSFTWLLKWYLKLPLIILLPSDIISSTDEGALSLLNRWILENKINFLTGSIILIKDIGKFYRGSMYLKKKELISSINSYNDLVWKALSLFICHLLNL